jgi:uncharacterized membrane protein
VDLALQIIRAILGSVLVFFVPGFAWTLVFFRKINILERIALAISLSIALITLATVVLNVIFDVKINMLNALITIIVLTVIPGGIYLLQRFRRHDSKMPGGE